MSESTIRRVVAGISLVLALAVYVLIPSQVISEPIPGTGEYVKITPVLFPLICAIAFALLGVILIFQSFFVIKTVDIVPGTTIGREGRINLAFTAFVLVFYSVLLEELGYIVTTILALLCLNLYFGNRGFWRLMLGVIIAPVALYFFFVDVMLVPLPEGFLFE